MAQSSEEPKMSLKLVIDKEKNRVVFAEASKDFVDVLCSLVSLPMGTIVRLLEKTQTPESSIVGCFHNLYGSVSVMDADNFSIKACKNLLLYPKSIKEDHFRRLKLNVDDALATKFFLCSKYVKPDGHRTSWCQVYSNYSSLKCKCGNLMTKEVQIEETEQDDGVFLSWRTSFIITDDLKVSLNSMGVVLNVLNDLGYDGFDKLQERLIDVGSEEMLTLLGYLFTSDAPLTDTFLKKPCMARKQQEFTPQVQVSEVPREADPSLCLKVFVRKTDMVILYAECREDFINFLFTFLAIPLEFAWDLNKTNKDCIGNLCRSVKDLIFADEGESTVSKCILPYYYNCDAQLLDVVFQDLQGYECLVYYYYPSICILSKKIAKNMLSSGNTILKLTPIDPKSESISDSGGAGFVKGKTNFIVTDDLVVAPMNSSSTFSLLSNLQMNISDIEEQVINITKAEAISLLRASLITTSALTNGLSNFLSKKMPKEATQSTLKIPKSEETL